MARIRTQIRTIGCTPQVTGTAIMMGRTYFSDIPTFDHKYIQNNHQYTNIKNTRPWIYKCIHHINYIEQIFAKALLE